MQPTTRMDPKAFWVGFNMVRGIGAVRLQALLNHFGDLSVAWQAPSDALQAAGLSPKIIENFLQVRNQIDLPRVWETILSRGIQVLTWDDDLYPQRLKEIDQHPPLLYVRGTLAPEDAWAVAVVGTRRVTSYGRQVASELGSFLARNNVTLVSGLARGVDAIAHEAAVAAGGRTLAVLGSGVDRIYPPENARLAERITRQGALLSDYALGTPPDGINFPPRNRIISGLSLAVVIVEAGDTSGALITATFAAEQGREVFAVPGNISAPQSRGTNRLIQDGARPLLKSEDILEALNLTQISHYQEARSALPVDETESALLHAVALEPLHINEICAEVDLPIDKVSATLAMLELKGMVRQVGGMQFVAIRETPGGYSTEERDV